MPLRGWITSMILRMNFQSFVHLRSCSQVSSADRKVPLSECCHGLSLETFRCLNRFMVLCSVTSPTRDHISTLVISQEERQIIVEGVMGV